MANSTTTTPPPPVSDQDTEDWSSIIVESVESGIIVSEKSGEIVLTNGKSQALFGYTATEFASLKIEDLLPRRARSVHAGYRSEYHQNPEVRPMGAGRELWALRKDGSEFPVEIGLTPLLIPGRDLVLSSILDITERKKAEQKLHENADKLKFQAEILDNVHDAVFYVDAGGLIQEWNEGARKLFGHTATEIEGHHVSRICHQDCRSLFERIENMIQKNGIAKKVVHGRTRDGNRVVVRVTVTMLNRDGSTGYLVCGSDITERKKLEAELLKVAEEQQRKIGQDIHDDLCSQLSGIGCLTKVLEDQLAEDRLKETELMKSIGEMVANAGTTARQIAHGLVPSILANQGLADALAELVNTNRKTYGIDIQISISDKEAINAIENETCVQIYRIAQEALANATMHSDAETIKVTASIAKARFEMTIEDEGKGMSEDLVSLGMGLTTMDRRAKLILADFDIHSSPGSGTKIRCSVPLFSK